MPHNRLTDEEISKYEKIAQITETSVEKTVKNILKHETLFAMFQKLAQEETIWIRYFKMATIVFSVLLAVGGFYLAWLASIEADKREALRTARISLAHMAEDRIKDKLGFWVQFSRAAMNMRKVREIIVLGCEYNQKISQYQQDLQRFNARYLVAVAGIGGDRIINDQFTKKFVDLTTFDQSVRDVCAKGAPADKVWRLRILDIEKIINASIEKDQQELKNLAYDVAEEKNITSEN